MSGEHASMRLLDDYARGDTPMAADTLWALESHLETCAPCRSRLAASVATEAPDIASLVATVRAGLEPQLDAAVPAPSWRCRPGRVPAWLAPVMAPWLVMTLSITLLALLLAVAAPPMRLGGAQPVVLIAPVLPLCAVAASWSRALDPAHEQTASTARAGLPLLLRRATTALAVVVPVLLAGGWLTGAMTAAQWLLPSLAFTSTALALGSVIGVTRAAVTLVAAWVVVIAAPAWLTGRLPFALHPDQLPAWGLLLTLGTGAVIARRNTYPTL
ncbi:zf-HC2 domain-containing protein [Kitasatospora sp. NPDC088346]|uniref:zf-HC2 domain-containing protein n=1 Tax=Kitasatospora sp. NPDC088346 TaxID=3364073 RepID=UPI0038249609